MTAPEPPEVWLRGPVPGIPPLLQPVAHALLQAVEEVRRVVGPLSPGPLWARPGGAASVAEAARVVGYGSEAAFSRAFKKLVGVPPAAWRDARRRGSDTAR